jgi:hypothetical protein
MKDTLVPSKVFAGYAREQTPFGSYLTLVGLFNGLFAGFLLLMKQARRSLPEQVHAGDIVLLGIATYKLSRLISKDKVTSFLRAPFSEFEEDTSSSEVNEKPRGTGMQYALGELLTCPFCIGQWVAAFFTYGLAIAPRVTRLVGSVFAILMISDFLHHADAGIKKYTEQ